MVGAFMLGALALRFWDRVFIWLHRPTMPLGSSSVTTMKSAPSANSQTSGRAPVSQVLPKFTRTAPMIGPTSVPRPPTATQRTASMELPGANSPGLMMPT